MANPVSTQPILLSEITTPDKAQALFQHRRSPTHEAASKFHSGNHWQDGKGWIGAIPKPGDAEHASTQAYIRDAFVSENVIKEIVDRHVSGLLGREPLWGFLPSDAPNPTVEKRRQMFSRVVNIVRQKVSRQPQNPDRVAQEADDALTVFWNDRKIRRVLKQALTVALNEDRAVLRYFIPTGLRNDQGQIVTQKDLTSALTYPRLEVLTSDKAGVFIDAPTQKEFGVYLYKQGEKQVAEVTFVENGLTVLDVLVENESRKRFTFELGGRMLIYQLERSALVTEQVQSNQRSLNLALTMMMRNVNLAGSLERTILNAEKPTKQKRVADNSEQGFHYETVDAEFPVGPGVVNALVGVLIKDADGNIINRANPNISFRDPVKIDTFTGTRDQFYSSILGQAHQRFALIAGDATTSGLSRQQARAEFESDLRDSKDPMDDCGRWTLETGLRLAGQLCGRRDVLNLRCDFNCVIESGPVSPEERKANRDDVSAKLMSKETAMSRGGTEDTDAELERIQQEARDPTNPAPPTNSKPAR